MDMAYYAFLIGVIAICAMADVRTVYSGTFGDGFTWTFDDTTATLTIDGTGDMPSLCNSLPWSKNVSAIQNVVVNEGITAIGACAFKSHENLVSVSLPQALNTISNAVFSGCSKLPSVVIPDTTSTIAPYAFYNCISLVSVDIPDNVDTIDSSTFEGCSNLTSVHLPEQLKNIQKKSFMGCSSLTNINIPSTVSSIYDYAFLGCGFTSFTIPENVKTLGEGVFSSCNSLESIYVDGSKFKSIDGVLFDNTGKTLLQYPSGRKGGYNIPENTTSVEKCAFMNCLGITSVSFSQTVDKIGERAFYRCFNLENVTLPSSMTSIGDNAFYNCYNLRSLVLPSNMSSSIGEYAFSGCSNLTSVAIPYGVSSLKQSVFESCTSLTRVEIPESVGGIGLAAFAGCSSLKNLDLSGVRSLGQGAFAGCSSLTSVEIPHVSSMEGYVFNQCSSLTRIVIPRGVRSIKDSAFENCSSLSNVTIPQGVTEIGNRAFIYTNLSSVVIPASVEKIGMLAFSYMRTTLKSVIYLGSKCEGAYYPFALSSVRYLCVSPNYTSNSFCDVTVSSKTATIELIESIENSCVQAVCGGNNLTGELWPNASEWASRSDGCVEFSCDSDNGFVHLNLCNSTESGEKMCYDGSCIVKDDIMGKQWAVEIDMDVIDFPDFSTFEVVQILEKLSGIFSENWTLGSETNEQGSVVRFVLFVQSENVAHTVEDAVNRMNKGSECDISQYGVLCQSHEARVIPKTIGGSSDLSSSEHSHSGSRPVSGVPSIHQAKSLLVTGIFLALFYGRIY